MLLSAIYWLTVKLYAAALRIASLFNLKAKLFIEGRKGLLEHITATMAHEQRPRIWMHCASLGEFEQGRPVLEQLRTQYPGYAIVLTFFSPSGYEVRKNYEGADYVFYLPLDSRKNAKQFIEAVQPKLSVFVKYELWYYYLTAIAKRSIPAILISARFRKEQPFFKFYGGLHRKMLRCFNAIFVQDKDSETLLHTIGINNVAVNGDTRFDRVIEAATQIQELPIAHAFCRDNKVIVAGSTWKEDEEFLKKTFDQLPPHWKLILVPHEVHDSHIQEIEKLFQGETVRWSAWSDTSDKRILLVDKVGLLLQLYRYANVAWIGGGFGSAGVHNVLEAAVYGLPCAYGPVFHQFIEAEELIQAGGAITVTDPGVFLTHIKQWENDTTAGTAAKNYVLAKGGATQAIMSYLAEKNILSAL